MGVSVSVPRPKSVTETRGLCRLPRAGARFCIQSEYGAGTSTISLALALPGSHQRLRARAELANAAISARRVRTPRRAAARLSNTPTVDVAMPSS